MDSQTDDDIIAGTGISVNDEGHKTTIAVNIPGSVGDEVTIGVDGVTTDPRFYPESETSDSGVQLAIRAGVPTLTQATALTYSAEIEGTATQRTGQAVVVKFNTSNDVKDYAIHIGSLQSSSNGSTSNRYSLSSLTEIGTQGGFKYLTTSLLTVPANTLVYVIRISAYAAQQIKDALESAGGGGGAGDITCLLYTSPSPRD